MQVVRGLIAGMILVPLHRGYDGLKLWQDFRVDQKLDAAGDAWLAANEPLTFEGKHHLMDGRWADGEEALHVGFGRWAAGDERIGMDEGQVLALLVGEGWFWDRGVHVT